MIEPGQFLADSDYAKILSDRWVIFPDYLNKSYDAELLRHLEFGMNSGGLDIDFLGNAYDGLEFFVSWIERENVKITPKIREEFSSNIERLVAMMKRMYISGNYDDDINQCLHDLAAEYTSAEEYAAKNDFYSSRYGPNSEDSHHLDSLGRFVRFIAVQPEIQKMTSLYESKKAEELLESALFVTRHRHRNVCIISDNLKLPAMIERAVEHTKNTDRLSLQQKKRALREYKEYPILLLGTDSGDVLVNTAYL